ncbi:hypothetical protein G6F56_008613 [Rhizopus delemar]|nr:hypothetical protein G6F56_008613 [Rhizopus delemar]
MAQTYSLDKQPTPQEAENLVKRHSSGFNFQETKQPTTPLDDKSLKLATFSLQRYLKEKDFAVEFLERGGLASLCDIIQNSSGNTLAYALNSFLSLMEHNMGWETLDPALAINMVHILVTQPLSTIARPATVILERLCANESEVFGYPTLHQAMQDEPDFIKVLVDRLLSPEYLLSTASLSLLIAMLRHVTVEHQTQLVDAFEHSAMKKNVLRLMGNHPTDEMKLLIIDYQTAYLQNIGKRQTTALTGNIDQIEILQNIWKSAKVEHVKTLGLKKWKKIGFSVCQHI